MQKQKDFTLKEFVVVIIIIVILIAIFGPILGPTPPEHAYQTVCLSNMHALSKGWIIYADENKGNLIGGDIGQAKYDWIPKPVVTDRTDIEGQKTNIQNSKLWKYVMAVEAYHCLADDRIDDNKGPWLSYSIVGGLNGQDRQEEDKRNYLVATKLDQIKFPEEKIVFVEENAEFGWNPRSWQIYDPQDQTKWTWQDPIAIYYRHSSCAMFSFADGHAEKYKWQDERTPAMSEPPAETGTMKGHTVGHVEQKENPDLLWMKERYTWVEK